MEKWLQRKPNPYTNAPLRRRVVPMRRTYQGIPAKMFKDSDKDGVMNVFDCKPFNKRKQDVISPQNYGGGMSDMYGRQENARVQREYQKQLKEFQRQEEERLAELRRIQGETKVIDNTVYVGSTTYKDTPMIFTASGELVRLDSTKGQAEVARQKDMRNLGGGQGKSVPGKTILTKTGFVSAPASGFSKTILAPSGTKTTISPGKNNPPKQSFVQKVTSFFKGKK